MKQRYNSTLLFIPLIAGYFADEKTFTEARAKIRDSINALLPKAQVNGEIDATIVAQIETMAAQDKQLEVLLKQTAESERLKNATPTERFQSLGLGNDDQRNFSKISILDACRVALSGGRPEGILKEMQQEAAREWQTACVPAQIGNAIALPKNAIDFLKYKAATQSVSGSNLGSQFVQTDVRMDLLATTSNLPVPAMVRAGARSLTGLVGNILLPKIAPTGALEVKAENANANAADHATSSASLQPWRLPVYVDVSDQLVMQTDASVNNLLLGLLLERLAVQKDIYALTGTGSSQPTGLNVINGVGSVTGAGADGNAPLWAHIIELESDVEVANAMGNVYMTNAKVRGKLKQTPKQFSGVEANWIWEQNNTMNGYGTVVSNIVPDNLSRGASSGICSEIIFGDFSQMILATWGGLMIENVRDKAGAIAGTGTIVATEFFDVGFLRPFAFSTMENVLTS